MSLFDSSLKTSLVKKPVTISPKKSLLQARDVLTRYKIGRIVVVDNTFKPVGIITEKDLTRSIYVLGAKPIETIRVSDFMSTKLITIKTTGNIYDCAKLMIKHGISSIIVLNSDKTLAGIVTKTDLVNSFLIQATSGIKAADIMTKKVIAVLPHDSMFLVQSVMINNKISRVIVQRNNNPVGVITYKDFIPTKTLNWSKQFLEPDEISELQWYNKPNEFNVNRLSYLLDFRAEDVMTPNPLTIGVNEYASMAALLMIRHGISGIPVVQKSKLKGIITKMDIVRTISKYS